MTKLEKEVYEPEMEEDEMEDEEMEVLAWSRNLSSIFEIRINLIFFFFLIQASMEETIVEKEEMVEKEMRDNTGEDEIINAP